MAKVAVVYHYYAHYRYAILNELANSNKNDYYFICGETTDINIKTINLESNPFKDRIIKVSNLWFFKKKLLWQKKLLSIVLNSNYDVYVFLGSPYYISTWVASILARIKGKKIYYWMHGHYKDTISFSDYFKVFVFYKLANGFFLYGNRSFNKLKALGVVKEENMKIVYNSLDYVSSSKLRKRVSIEKIIEFRQKFFEKSNLPTVIFIGRLNKTKKIDFLIKAQNLLFLKSGTCLFNTLVIGDGDETDNLKHLVNCFPYLSTHIHFTGAIYDELLNAEMLLCSDLCVTPGEVGLTAIHSLSYGTPVISHNNFNIQMPEVESIIEGITGSYYEYGNLTSLANTIEKWFDKNPYKTVEVMENCFNIIDSRYNPLYQCEVFDEVLHKLG